MIDTIKDLIIILIVFAFLIYMIIGFGIGVTWPLWWEW